MLRGFVSCAAIACAVAVQADAQDAAAILRFAVNTPGANYSAYGPTQSAKLVKDSKVQGGVAFRIEISAKGPDPFTSGATSPVSKPISKGDRVTVAFWARAPKLPEGRTTPIPFVGLQLANAPYTQFVTGSAEISREWKIYEVRGVADKNYAAGQVNVGLHLSAEKAIIDLGPIFVLDFGPKK